MLNLLPVTQADRDAAGQVDPANRVDYKLGRMDGSSNVQAFARHRISHSLPGDVGMRGLLVEVQHDLINLIDPLPCASPVSCDARAILKKIDAALTPSPCPGDVGMAIEEAAARIKAVWFDYSQPIGMALFRKMAEAALDVPNCEHCDGTGDVHSIDGEWRGRCHCRAALTPSALSGDAGEVRENVLFNLTWIAPPSPELPDGRRVHPEPMTGRQSFPSWDKVLRFMTKRCAGTEFVSLTQTTSRTVDRSAEFRAALPSHQGAE